MELASDESGRFLAPWKVLHNKTLGTFFIPLLVGHGEKKIKKQDLVGNINLSVHDALTAISAFSLCKKFWHESSQVNIWRYSRCSLCPNNYQCYIVVKLIMNTLLTKVKKLNLRPPTRRMNVPWKWKHSEVGTLLLYQSMMREPDMHVCSGTFKGPKMFSCTYKRK